MFPEILNSETYSQAFAYVSKKYRQSKKCRLVQTIADPAAHYLFLAAALWLVNGLLYTHLPFPGLTEFFEKAPWFTSRWTVFYSQYLQPFSALLPFSGVWNDLAACILMAWVVPFALALVFMLLINLLYWPKGPAMAEDASSQEAALHLLNTARIAKRNAASKKARYADITAVFYVLTMVVILTLFIVEIIQHNPRVFSTIPGKDRFPLLAFTVAALCGYSILNYPLVLLLKLLSLCPIPKAHFDAMEGYLQAADPDAAQKEASQETPLSDFPATDPDTLPKGFFSLELWFSRISGFPCPITAQNFPKAWRWAARKLQWAQKRAPAAQIANAIAHPIYVLVLLVLTFGALYQQNIPMVNAFLDKAPKAVALWKNIRLFLYGSNATTLEQGLAWAKFLYLVPLALSCLAIFIVFLVYQPKSRKRDTADSPREQSRQLCLLLRDAKAAAKPLPRNIVTMCNIFFAIFWGALAFGLVVFYLQDPMAESLIAQHGTRIGWAVFAVFLVLALGYKIIALPLTLAIKLLTTTWVPKKALQAAEAWFDRCEDAANSEPSQPVEE